MGYTVPVEAFRGGNIRAGDIVAVYNRPKALMASLCQSR